MKTLLYTKITIYFVTIFLPLSLLQAGGTSFGIAQIGDPQVGIESQKKAKEGHIELIKKMGDIKAVTFPGDLIDGQDVSSYSFWFWFLRCFPCWQKGRTQTNTFKSNHLSPLEKAKIRVFLGAGNHDFGDATYSSLDLIKERHGHLYYAEKIGELNYLHCGVWPDKKTVLPWLKKELEKINGKPSAIAFHYNILNNHNRWWTIEERQAFLDAIRGKNVQAILTGHEHVTYSGSIEGIPVVCSGGNALPVSLFDSNGNYETTHFYTAQRQEDGTVVPVQTTVPEYGVYSAASTSSEHNDCKKSQSYVRNNY